MPSFNGEQLFRIKNREKSDSGITCEMEPVFYDTMGDCWLTDVRPAKKNGQEALDLCFLQPQIFRPVGTSPGYPQRIISIKISWKP